MIWDAIAPIMMSLQWWSQKLGMVHMCQLSNPVLMQVISIYRQISNMRLTKSPNLNVAHLVLQLSLPNPFKPGIKSRMKM